MGGCGCGAGAGGTWTVEFNNGTKKTGLTEFDARVEAGRDPGAKVHPD